MLTSIQLREEDNTTLFTLPVGVPSSSSPFFVSNVDGLGPVRASITTSPYAISDGTIFQHASVPFRNIVMDVEIKPNSSMGTDVAEHRETLYEYLPPKRELNLVLVRNNFTNGNSDVLKIKAYVEAVEPSIFSNDPKVQISLICPDPHFAGYTPVIINGKLGELLDVSSFGSASSGFLFDITLTKALSKLTIDPGFGEPLAYTESMLVGDRIRISTVMGDKYVRRTRAGVTTNELEKITQGSMGMGLDKRVRKFYVNKGTAAADAQNYTIRVTPKYVGL